MIKYTKPLRMSISKSFFYDILSPVEAFTQSTTPDRVIKKKREFRMSLEFSFLIWKAVAQFL